MARMLKTHGWDKPSPTEKSDSKPIEPLVASTAEELSTSVEPAEGSTEHTEPGHSGLGPTLGPALGEALGPLLGDEFGSPVGSD
jgi:hypothetical protein